jgi:hypothetical protein
MPYQQLSDGLYLLKQKSEGKGVDHYGILDVGNRLALRDVDGRHPVVIHQTPPWIRLNWLQDTGTWSVLGQITGEQDAKARMAEAFKNPKYDLFGHNCEHFARYVATGCRESTQLQAVSFVAGLATLAILTAR